MNAVEAARLHEAAHAIGASEVGWTVVSIGVHPNGAGRTISDRRPPSIDDARAAADAILFAMVGSQAVRAWAGQFDGRTPGDANDEDDVRAMAARLARLRGRSYWAVLDDERARARAWVRSHEDAIGTLASSLAANGDELAAGECGAAIERARRGLTWARPRPALPATAPAPAPTDAWQPAAWERPAYRPQARWSARPTPLRRVADYAELAGLLGRRDTWRRDWASWANTVHRRSD